MLTVRQRRLAEFPAFTSSQTENVNRDTLRREPGKRATAEDGFIIRVSDETKHDEEMKKMTND